MHFILSLFYEQINDDDDPNGRFQPSKKQRAYSQASSSSSVTPLLERSCLYEKCASQNDVVHDAKQSADPEQLDISHIR